MPISESGYPQRQSLGLKERQLQLQKGQSQYSILQTNGCQVRPCNNALVSLNQSVHATLRFQTSVRNDPFKP